MVYSFDIFDTVLFRVYARPVDLFSAVASELRIMNVITNEEEWVGRRIDAELACRKKSTHEEIQLAEIYRLFGEQYNVSAHNLDLMMQTELELELGSHRLNAEVALIIEKRRREGHQVIFISDMYLSQAFLRQTLTGLSILHDADQIYVSGEYRKTKHSGKLFREVLDLLRVEPEMVTHMGDNYASDFKMPSSMGIRAIHYKLKGITNRQSALLRLPGTNLQFTSLVVAASQAVRMRYKGEGLRSQITDVSSVVIAPILYGYVLWCLTEAARKGIQTLYFISRDGEILLKIAKEILTTGMFPVQCRYIYGSRQSYHLPSLTAETYHDIDWLFDDTMFLSVTTILERVQLLPGQIRGLLISAGFTADTWTSNLTQPARHKLKQLILHTDQVKALILDQAKQERETLIAYFRQEGIGSTASFGFVDIGWNGRLQRSISRILHVENERPGTGVTGFYFGSVQRLKAYPDDELNAYYYDRENEVLPYCNVPLVEKFVEGTHGGVKRFERQGSLIIPVLKADVNRNAIHWGTDVQQDAVVEFARQVSEAMNRYTTRHLSIVSNWLSVTAFLLNDFSVRPTREEADVYGSSFISEDQNESSYDRLAPAFSISDCVGLRLTGSKKYTHNRWLEGSLRRSRAGVATGNLIAIRKTLKGLLQQPGSK